MCYHSYQISIARKIKSDLYPNKPKDFAREELLRCPTGMPVFTKMVRNVYKSKDANLVYFFHGDFSMNALMGTYGKSKYLDDIRPGIYNHHPGGALTAADESVRIQRLINAKIVIYQGFIYLGDSRSVTIALDSLRLTLQEKQLPVTRFHFSRSSIEWSSLGVQVGIYYGSFVSNIKKTMRKLIKR
jgi:hypothetical protein